MAQRGRGRARSYRLPAPRCLDVNEWALWILLSLLYQNYEFYSTRNWKKESASRRRQDEAIWNAIECLDPLGTLRAKAEWLK